MTNPRDVAEWLRERALASTSTEDRRYLLMAAAQIEGLAGRVSLLECERASAERACTPPDPR